MSISLTHLAESLFVRIVNAEPRKFLDLAGLGGAPLPRDGQQIATADVPLARYGGRSFDGASRIDAIVRLGSNQAAAFERKLGTTRLTRVRVNEEWLPHCRASHGEKRWSGNIIAILEPTLCGPRHDRQRPRAIAAVVKHLPT